MPYTVSQSCPSDGGCVQGKLVPLSDGSVTLVYVGSPGTRVDVLHVRGAADTEPFRGVLDTEDTGDVIAVDGHPGRLPASLVMAAASARRDGSARLTVGLWSSERRVAASVRTFDVSPPADAAPAATPLVALTTTASSARDANTGARTLLIACSLWQGYVHTITGQLNEAGGIAFENARMAANQVRLRGPSMGPETALVTLAWTAARDFTGQPLLATHVEAPLVPRDPPLHHFHFGMLQPKGGVVEGPWGIDCVAAANGLPVLPITFTGKSGDDVTLAVTVKNDQVVVVGDEGDTVGACEFGSAARSGRPVAVCPVQVGQLSTTSRSASLLVAFSSGALLRVRCSLRAAPSGLNRRAGTKAGGVYASLCITDLVPQGGDQRVAQQPLWMTAAASSSGDDPASQQIFVTAQSEVGMATFAGKLGADDEPPATLLLECITAPPPGAACAPVAGACCVEGSTQVMAWSSSLRRPVTLEAAEESLVTVTMDSPPAALVVETGEAPRVVAVRGSPEYAVVITSTESSGLRSVTGLQLLLSPPNGPLEFVDVESSEALASALRVLHQTAPKPYDCLALTAANSSLCMATDRGVGSVPMRRAVAAASATWSFSAGPSSHDDTLPPSNVPLTRQSLRCLGSSAKGVVMCNESSGLPGLFMAHSSETVAPVPPQLSGEPLASTCTDEGDLLVVVDSGDRGLFLAALIQGSTEWQSSALPSGARFTAGSTSIAAVRDETMGEVHMAVSDADASSVLLASINARSSANMPMVWRAVPAPFGWRRHGGHCSPLLWLAPTPHSTPQRKNDAVIAAVGGVALTCRDGVFHRIPETWGAGVSAETCASPTRGTCEGWTPIGDSGASMLYLYSSAPPNTWAIGRCRYSASRHAQRSDATEPTARWISEADCITHAPSTADVMASFEHPASHGSAMCAFAPSCALVATATHIELLASSAIVPIDADSDNRRPSWTRVARRAWVTSFVSAELGNVPGSNFTPLQVHLVAELDRQGQPSSVEAHFIVNGLDATGAAVYLTVAAVVGATPPGSDVSRESRCALVAMQAINCGHSGAPTARVVPLTSGTQTPSPPAVPERGAWGLVAAHGSFIQTTVLRFVRNAECPAATTGLLPRWALCFDDKQPSSSAGQDSGGDDGAVGRRALLFRTVADVGERFRPHHSVPSDITDDPVAKENLSRAFAHHATPMSIAVAVDTEASLRNATASFVVALSYAMGGFCVVRNVAPLTPESEGAKTATAAVPCVAVAALAVPPLGSVALSNTPNGGYDACGVDIFGRVWAGAVPPDAKAKPAMEEADNDTGDLSVVGDGVPLWHPWERGCGTVLRSSLGNNNNAGALRRFAVFAPANGASWHVDLHN